MPSPWSYPFPLDEELEIYPYNPFTKPEDVKKLLTLRLNPRMNPFYPLPSKQPCLPEDAVTVILHSEAREPQKSHPRVFVATIESAPDWLNLPLDCKVIVEAFDPYGYNYNGVLRAQTAFCHTIGCYTKLEHLQGGLIPKFLGSFIFLRPKVNKRGERVELWTRLVIRGYIEGRFLHEVAPDSLSTKERQVIMERVIEADTIIDKAGVALTKIRPHQFILIQEKEEFKVVVYQLANSGLDPNVPGKIHSAPGLLPSPLLKWTRKAIKWYTFDKYVDWPWVSWLYDKYGDDRESLTELQMQLAYGFEQDEEELKRLNRLSDGENDKS